MASTAIEASLCQFPMGTPEIYEGLKTPQKILIVSTHPKREALMYMALKYFASGYQISSKSGHPRWSNDVIYNNHGGRGGSILLPVSYLMSLDSSEVQNLSTDQISSTEI